MKIFKAAPADSAPKTFQPQRLVVAVLIFWTLLISVVSLLSYLIFHITPPYDGALFRLAALDAIQGVNPYTRDILFPNGQYFHFAYPPFALVALLPTALMPAEWFHLLWSIFYIAVPVIAVAVLAYRKIIAQIPNFRYRHLIWVAIAIFALTNAPVIDAYRLGQIGPLLMFLVFADLVIPADKRKIGKFTVLPQGILIGLAAAIKIFPGIAILFLLVTRRWKAAITASVAFVAANAMSFLIVPNGLQEYLRTSGPEYVKSANGPERFIGVDSHSVIGFFMKITEATKLPSTVLELALVLGTTVIGLLVAVYVHRRSNSAVPAAAIVGLTMTLASPIAWTHYLVWIVVVPAAILLAGRNQESNMSVRLMTAALLVVPFAFAPPYYKNTVLPQPQMIYDWPSTYMFVLLVLSIAATAWFARKPKAKHIAKS